MAMKDYRGAFNPNLKLEDLDHGLLARYGRDIMLANHIHDRSALAPVAVRSASFHKSHDPSSRWL